MARRNIWEPLGTLMTMQQAVDRLYDETYGRRQDWRRGERVELLPVDAYSTPEKVVILASVPGLSPEDVDITIEGETLTIRGTIQPPAENVDYVIQERRFGPFSRTLTLNVPVQAEKAEAVFENGVLTLTIPKAEEVKPRQIKVKSGSGD
ncbi:MAG TPA: Hsp20/alpha crystallin family protein [Anaerolineae bacterium]|nr:Hsp20/alpha crystallin family protein [Anaerolineae bacterium]